VHTGHLGRHYPTRERTANNSSCFARLGRALSFQSRFRYIQGCHLGNARAGTSRNASATTEVGKVEIVDSDALCMRTDRLDLAAATVEQLEAELEDPQRFANLIGAVVLPSWPPGEYDRHAISYFHERLSEGGASAAGWYVWYAIRRTTADCPATLVAGGGYFGPPLPDGTVEIGYSVVPEWRRHGYATELVEALVKRAFDQPSVCRILAEAEVANVASIGVLTRCGFRRMGTGREPHYDRFQRDRGQ
jgi:[ribosomal protein S5]-alanine N-acetyltransferase